MHFFLLHALFHYLMIRYVIYNLQKNKDLPVSFLSYFVLQKRKTEI